MQKSRNSVAVGSISMAQTQMGFEEKARKRAHAQRRMDQAIRPTLELLEVRQLLSGSLPAGALDPTFGTSGIAANNFSSTPSSGAAVAVSTQGSTAGDVVVADSANGQLAFGVTVFSPSGGVTDTKTLTIGSSSAATATSVVIDSSNRVVVGGYATNPTSGGTGDDFVVARYILNPNSTLSLDTNFGSGGYVTTDIKGANGKDDLNALAIEPATGEIIAVGSSGTHDAVVGYTSTGALDGSFGSSGVFTTSGTTDDANAVTIDSTGNIFIAGNSGNISTSKGEFIELTSGGAMVGSRVSFTIGNSASFNAIAPSSTAGDYYVAGTSDSNLLVAEVTSSGVYVPGFNGTGYATTSVGAGAVGTAVAVQANGKVVVGGNETDPTTGNDFFTVARYSTAGALDANFGTGGVTTSDVSTLSSSTSGSSTITGVAIEPDGKIIAAGTATSSSGQNEFAVARYVANNAPTLAGNTSFDTIDEHQTNSPGNTVASLVMGLGEADVDGDALGIAITAADNTNGTWQYSTDGGTTYQPIPVSTGSAFLLAQTTTGMAGTKSNLVRFVPAGNFTGTAALTIRAWDETQGASGSLYTIAASDNANLNTFSANSKTATITVTSLVAPVYVNSAWAGSAQDATVTDSLGYTHSFGIDAFATIQDGVNFVASGGTVNVDGYSPSGSASPGALAPYAEAVNISASVEVTGYGAALPTVTAPASASDVSVINVTAPNVTVENLNITVDQPHAAAGITGIDAVGAHSSVLSGLSILNNTITSTGTGGALQQDSSYGPPNKYSAGIAVLASGSSTVPNVTITGNQILPTVVSGTVTSTVGRGIWADQIEGSINGNTIEAVAYEDALLTFLSGPTTFDSNTLHGTGLTITEPNAGASVDVGSNTFAPTYGVDDGEVEVRHDYNASAPVSIHNNQFTLLSSTIGVLSAGSLGVSVDSNTFTPAAGATGTVAVDVDTQEPSSTVPAPVVASAISITNNTFNATAAASATAIIIANHASATPASDFGPIAVTGNTFTSGLTTFIAEAAPTSTVTFSGDTYTAIEPGNVSANIDATNNVFGVSSGDSLASNDFTLGDYYAVENKITDGIDYTGAGLVRINEANIYVAQNSDLTADGGSSGSIQRAVNLASGGNTVNVQAGTFGGTIIVNKSVTLLGANAANNPTNGGSRSAETIIEPVVSGASPYSGTHTFLIDLLASDVTVEGFTLTGQNASLPDSGGVALTETGASPIYAQAVEGIASFNPTGITDISSYGNIPAYVNPANVKVENNIIQDLSYQGVDIGWGSSGNPTDGNVISSNLVHNIGAYNDEGDAVRVYNNFNADITSNQIVNTRMGIEYGNFSQPNPGSTGSLDDNTIEVRRRGILYNLTYTGSTAASVTGNTITAAPDDLSLGGSVWVGVYLLSQQGTVNSTFLNNSIDGAGSNYTTTAGYAVTATDSTASVTLSGGTIANVTYGVWEDNNDPNGFTSATANMGLTISGVGITASTAGVYVHDTSATIKVSATITGGTTISTGGAGTGILVSGVKASATVSSTAITNSTTGIEADNGLITIGTGDTIAGGTTGLALNGSSTAVIGNTLNNLAFSGQSGNYITLANGALYNSSPVTLDATSATFNGSSVSTTAQGYAVEDKITDAIDVIGLGFVRVKANNVFVTPNSFVSPAASLDTGAISRAVAAASDGDTVHVEAGTYHETQVVINKGVDLQGDLAATTIIDGGGEANTITNSSGILHVTATDAAQPVTIEGLTLQNAGTPSDAADEDPTSLITATPIAGSLTIQNDVLVGENDATAFDSGIVIFSASSTAAISITNVDFSKMFQGLLIEDALSETTISGNTFHNLVAGTYSSQTYAPEGLFLLSDSTTIQASVVAVTGNHFQNYSGYGIAVEGGYQYAGTPAGKFTNLQIENNQISVAGNNAPDIGIYNSAGSGSGITSATISGNTISGDASAGADGIDIYGLNSGISLTNNTISNTDIGIDADGDSSFGAPSVTILGNSISSSSTAGIEVGDGTLTVGSGNTVTGGAIGLELTGSGAAIAGNTLNNLSLSGQSGNYITLSNGAESGQTLDGTSVSFDGKTGATASLAQDFAIEDKITDGLDTAGLGVVQIKANTEFVTATSGGAGVIQLAVNAAAPGDTVEIAAGTYTDNVTINKPLTIDGANAGIAGSATRGAETIVTPTGLQTAVFTVSNTHNVTFDGLTIDGYNPSVTGGGTLYSGDTSDVSYGIHTDTTSTVTGLTVENDVIKRVYVGVRGDNLSTGNSITNNLFDSIGNFDFGYAVSLRSDFYANITNNVMTRVWTGIHLNNFHNAGGPASFTISGNSIQYYAGGVLDWLQYGSATPLTLNNNQISVQTGEPRVAGNAGLMIVTQQNSDSIAVTSNTITGADYGVIVFNAPTTNTVTLGSTDAIVNPNIAGVLVTDNLNFNPVGTTNFLAGGVGAASTVNLTGLTISGAAAAGVIVDASGSTATGVTITGASITGSSGTSGVSVQGALASASVSTTEITGFATGVSVTGGTATITGNTGSIYGNTVGIEVNGGSATISNNHIYDNTTGIDFTNGGAGSVTSNNFAGSTSNGTDIEIEKTAGTVNINDGNAFAGSTDYIENLSAENFDLSGDTTTTFGGFNAATTPVNAASAPSFYATEDKIVDAIDQSGLGLVRIHSGNVFVTPNSYNSPTTTTPSIQRGVDAAAAGDVVNIENNASAYVGQVSITKNITLLGQSETGVTIQPGASPASQFTDAGANDPVIYVGNNASGTIKNLTIDGDNEGPNDGGFEGVAFFKAGGTVNDVTIDGQVYVGIFADSSDSTARSLVVTGDTISNYQKNAMQLAGPGLNVDIERDTLTGGGATDAIAQNGIVLGYSAGNLGGGGAGLIEDSTISGNIYKSTANSEYDATDVLLYGSSGDVTISGNQLSQSDVAVYGYLTGGTVSVMGNTITTSDGAGVVAEDGKFSITSNSIENDAAGTIGDTGDGIDVIADPPSTTTAVISGNTIESNAGTGISVSGTGASAAITGNTIDGNGTGIDFATNGAGSVTGNNFAGSTSNGTDLEIESTAGAVTIGDGNAFAGSTDYIENLSAENFDLSGDTTTTFGGFNAATTAVTATSLPSFYATEDKIVDAIDQSGLGLVRIHSGNVFVTPNSYISPAVDDTGAVQRAIDAASTGDNVQVDAGTYLGAVNVDKTVDVLGAGSTGSGSVIAGGSSNAAVTVNASGASSSNPLTFSGLLVEGGSRAGIDFNSTLSDISLSNVVVSGSASYGIEVDNSAVLSDLQLTDISVSTNTTGGVGFNVATTGSVNGLTILGSHFDNNAYGLETQNATHALNNQTRFTNISISGSTFNNDTFKGIYVETLDHATLNNITVDNSGTGTSSPNGVDLNLKYGTYTNIVIENSSFSSDATGNVSSAALAIDGRNDAPSYNTSPASINGVTLSNLTFTGASPVDLSIGDNVSGVSLSGVSLGGSGVGLVDYDTVAGLSLGDTSFAGSLNGYIIDSSPAAYGIDATGGATFAGFDTGTGSVPADASTYYAIEDKIADGIDVPNWGLVRLLAKNVFVTPNSFFTQAGTTTPSIQRGVNAAVTGDMVNVAPGLYEDGTNNDTVVNIDKAVTVIGTGGADNTTIDGNSADNDYYVVTVSSSNATFEGFTVTNPIYSGDADASGVLVESLTNNAPLTGVSVNNNIIHDIGLSSRSYDGTLTMGINVEGENSDSGVSNSSFDDNTIYNIANADASGDGFAIGILTAGDVGQEVNGNSIDGNTIYNVSNPALGAAIDAGYGTENTTIDNNIIGVGPGNAAGPVDIGIRTSTGEFGPVSIDANTISNASVAGISLNSPDAETAYRNTVSTSTVGLLVTGVLTSATENYFTDNGTGVLITSTAGPVGPININSISGNTVAGLENDSSSTVDATQNWWGSANGPTTPLNTFASTGTGDKVVGTDVTIAPFLTDGIDSAPATPGFQHDPASSAVPAAPTGLTLLASDDSGASHSDDITNVTTPHITGSSSAAEAGDTVTLFDTDGTTILGTSIVGSDGTWTVQSSSLSNGAHTLTAKITDTVGVQSTASTSLTVDIDAQDPVPTITDNATSHPEGTKIDLAGAANDPDPTFGTPTFAYTVTDDNGQSIANGGNANFSFTPDDNGTYTVKLTVTDAAGNVGVATDIITVTNVAPTATLTVDSNPGTEGAVETLTASATDPGTVDYADGFTYSYTVTKQHDGGAITTFASGTSGPESTDPISFMPDDDGTYVVTVTATDKDGGISNSATQTLVITNVAPTPTINGAPTTAPEGTPIPLTASATDPSSVDTAAGFTYAWTVSRTYNSVTTTGYATGTGSSFTFTPDHGPATYTVTLTATDKDGGSQSTSTTINATYAPPTVGLTGSMSDPSNPTANDAEGSTFTLTLSPVNNPGYLGGNRVQNYFINWGDGTTQEVSAATLPESTGGTVTHVYTDGTVPQGTTTPDYTIHVDIQDTDGYHTDAGVLGVVVYNLPPTATFSGSGSVSEGASGNVLFFNQYDPSSVDTSAGFTYSYDFGDTGTFEITGSTSPSATVPPSYLSTPGTVTVRGRISDKDGGYTDYTHQITVTNVAPTVNPIANVNVGAGSAFTATGGFTDPGNDSPWKVYANYTYNASTNSGLGTLVQTSSSKSFTLSNTYATPGTYTVLVTVVDSLGASGTTTFSVTATSTAFAVSSFTPNPSGFDVTFNRALNTSALNLYKGLSNTYGAADLTLTGPNGPVHGSFIYDPTTDTGHFVATGGVLPLGAYSASLVGSTAAFQDLSGNPLQSNDGSGNYDTTFNITTIGDVVSAPDFARGPGQPVNVPLPGQPLTVSTAGLPITISDGTNVTSVDFELIYNPNLLNITAVTLASDLPAGWGVTSNVTVTPGDLHITVSGPLSAPLGAGSKTLIELTATVPTGSTYGQGEVLQIENLRVNEGNIGGTADEAVMKDAFLGDVTGNRGYSATDASYISNVVATNATGFDAFPLIDPVIIGDATNDGTLSGLDASVLLEASIGNSVSQLPAIPAGNTTTLPQSGLDPTVSIPSNVLANPGGMVTLPLNISDISGLQGANFTITYNATLVTFDSAALGAINSGGWTILASNPSPGTIILGISDNGVDNTTGPGSIANLTFTVNAGDVNGVTPVTLAGYDGGLNEGALPLTPVNGSVNIETPTVGSAYTFYYGSSAFDHSDTAPNITNDFAAIATDKLALLPSQTASFTNVTSYPQGLDGLLIDFPNLVPGTVLTPADFQFSTGTTGTTWTPLTTAPTIIMGTDPNNGDVVADLVWANGTIKNTWLKVTVVADSNTALAATSTFYYGNLVGATGASVSGGKLKVLSADDSATQQHENLLLKVGVSSVYDINRDGKVTSTDDSIVQQSENLLGGLTLFTAASNAPVGAAAAPTVLIARSTLETTTPLSPLTATAQTLVATNVKAVQNKTVVTKGLSNLSSKIVVIPHKQAKPEVAKPSNVLVSLFSSEPIEVAVH
jgi:uncharacterized delta-60 repeat protein